MTWLCVSWFSLDSAPGFPSGAGRPLSLTGSRHLSFLKQHQKTSLHQPSCTQCEPGSVLARGWLGACVHGRAESDLPIHREVGRQVRQVPLTSQVSPATQRRGSCIDLAWTRNFFPFGGILKVTVGEISSNFPQSETIISSELQSMLPALEGVNQCYCV